MYIKRKKEDKEDIRVRDAAKERDRRRKKMLRTKYGQRPLKHAKKGILSCVLAGAVIALLCFMIIFSFISKGKVAVGIGVLGLLTTALAGMGLHLGIKGFKERDKNYITCRAGVICNGVVLGSMAVIFIRGII